jgi:hypothetical protein
VNPRVAEAAVAIVLASVVGTSCARVAGPRAGAATPARVADWPVDRLVEHGAGSAVLAGPVRIGVADGHTYIVALRLTLEEGAVALALDGAAGGAYSRTISRLGPYLALIPVRAYGSALALSLEQPQRAGPVRASTGELSIVEVEPSTVEATTSALVEAFERETGRIADPAVDNLVPNADFADDDEYRGLPRDWSIYGDPRVDARLHTLTVASAGYDGRPLAASGPVPVSTGQRYLARCDLRAVNAPVRFRAVDYDEIRQLGESAVVDPADGWSTRTIEFRATDSDRAVRLWLEAANVANASVEIRAIQLEVLPEVAK